MAYIVRMAKAAAPAIDRTARRMHDAGYPHVMDRVQFQYLNTQMAVKFDSPEDYKLAASVLAEELRADGFGWTTAYDNGNAATGVPVGLRVTHPAFLTRVGTEVQDRPNTWRIEGPMPDGRVPLDADAIEQLAQEAAETMRDLLRTRAALENGGVVPEDSFPATPAGHNPLETQFDRDVAEWNGQPVEEVAPKPRTLNEVFGTKDDDEDS